jgi:hypothetical protein
MFKLLTRDLFEINDSAWYSPKRIFKKKTLNLTELKRHRRFQITMAVKIHTLTVSVMTRVIFQAGINVSGEPSAAIFLWNDGTNLPDYTHHNPEPQQGYSRHISSPYNRTYMNIAYMVLRQIIIIIIIIITVLQPFDGSWPLFQFLDPIHSR